MTRALVTVILAILMVACSEKPAPGSQSGSAAPSENATSSGRKQDKLAAELRQQVTTTMEASCEHTARLAESVTQFLDAPTQETLSKARENWAGAHLSFRRVAFLYTLTDLRQPQLFGERDPIDATPMLPGYLDQVPGYPSSGLVYSEVPLTPDFLRKEHQSTDFYYLTQGFHPLESLLWPPGEQSDKRESGTGQVAAFVAPEKVPENQINSVDRRRELLRLIAGQLQRDMKSVCKPSNINRLQEALLDLKGQRVSVLTRVERSLSETTGNSLQGWATHPSGEDRNGMPVAHSPRALGDFKELATLTSELRERWLPLFLGDHQGEADSVHTALGELASKLASIRLQKQPVASDPLRQARQQLAKVSDQLTSSAMQEADTE